MIPESPLNKMVPLMEDRVCVCVCVWGGGGGGGGEPAEYLNRHCVALRIPNIIDTGLELFTIDLTKHNCWYFAYVYRQCLNEVTLHKHNIIVKIYIENSPWDINQRSYFNQFSRFSFLWNKIIPVYFNKVFRQKWKRNKT